MKAFDLASTATEFCRLHNIELTENNKLIVEAERQLYTITIAGSHNPDLNETVNSFIADTSSSLDGHLVSFFLTNIPNSQHHSSISRVSVVGMHVNKLVELSSAILPFEIYFERCTFSDGIDLNDASTQTISFHKCIIRHFHAERAKIEGSLRFWGPRRLEEATTKEHTEDQNLKCLCLIQGQVRLSGARIAGNLDFRTANLGNRLDEIADMPALVADGVRVAGNCMFGSGFYSNGGIRLRSARIRQSLELAGTSVRAASRFGLDLQDAEIGGNIILGYSEHDPIFSDIPEGLTCDGGIDLRQSVIGGSLRIQNCALFARPLTKQEREDDQNLPTVLEPLTNIEHFTAAYKPVQWAFVGDGMQVAGHVRITINTRIIGEFRLINARIGRDLIVEPSIIDVPGGLAFAADGICVSGTGFIQGRKGDPLRISGIVRLVHAEFKQGLFFRHLRFEPNSIEETTSFRLGARQGLRQHWWFKPEDRGIDLRYIHVYGSLRIEDIDSPSTFSNGGKYKINLSFAKCDLLSDECACWPTVVGCTQLTGFEYKLLLDDSKKEEVFIKYVRYQHQHVDFFTPQPYAQLAAALRLAGSLDVAKKVCIAREVDSTEFSQRRWIAIQYRCGILGPLIDYGYSPFKIFIPWVLLWIVSSLVFCSAYRNGEFVHTRAMIQQEANISQKQPEKAYPYFNAAMFSFETVFPLISVGQTDKWVIEGAKELDDITTAQILIGVNPIFGWFFASFLVIGVSGLFRNE